MAFDGIVVAGLLCELREALLNTHITKIAQPEADELLITLKGNGENKRLLISANASLPLIYLTNQNKTGPLTAPNFCMLLRKHIGSGKILEIEQPSLERILIFTIEHRNELGDLAQKKLIVELMGKHSNIIFCDENNQILDSIKHISAKVSSLREVLPGRPYFIPETAHKMNPFEATASSFLNAVKSSPMPLIKAIYSSYTGLSPLIASDLCYRAGLDGDRPPQSFPEKALLSLAEEFLRLLNQVREKAFVPVIYEKNQEPMEFSAVPLAEFPDYTCREFSSISELLAEYYGAKAAYTRIRQKSSDLRHIVNTAYERTLKKYDLQLLKRKDTEKMESCRIFGELLTAYAYEIPEGAKTYRALNYHTGEEITIPLDKDLSPNENAQKYYSRYQKLKRTFEAVTLQLKETEAEKEHLESILMALDLAENEEDLIPIRLELQESGYIKRRSGDRKVKSKSRPWHYVSSDGFDLYVGRNNFQNDELTFKVANAGDLWFHAKKMPGSHVILKTGGKEVPDRAYEEAASLAAFYSRGKDSDKVEVDYLRRKDVKKTPGTPPGYVIYYTNYSMTVTPSEGNLTRVNEKD